MATGQADDTGRDRDILPPRRNENHVLRPTAINHYN